MRRLRAIIISLSFFAAVAAGFFGTSAALAQSAASTNAAGAPATLQLEIPIPVSPLEQGVSNAGGAVSDVSQYIGRIYNFAIGIVGLIAAVMMIIGGFQYLTSAGDAGKIGAAKKRITDAIIGLVLMLGSYALLNTINPALLAFKPLSNDVKDVTTELALDVLPWCEDLAAKGTVITQYDYSTGKPGGHESNCGDVGSFEDKNTQFFCIFRGDNPSDPSTTCKADLTEISSTATGIRVHQDVPEPKLCFPSPLYKQAFIKKRMADFMAGKVDPKSGVLKPPPLAFCSSCAFLGVFFTPSKANPNGSAPNPSLCTLYETMANKGPFDTSAGARQKTGIFGTKYTQYCAFDASIPGCASSVIECKDRSDGECDDYDSEPLYYDAVDPDNGNRFTTGWWIQPGHISDDEGDLASHPGHLSDVCFANPCNYGTGCKGSSSIVAKIRTVSRIIDSGIAGIQNCVSN